MVWVAGLKNYGVVVVKVTTRRPCLLDADWKGHSADVILAFKSNL